LIPALSEFVLGSPQFPEAFRDKRLTQINGVFLMLGSLTIFLAASAPVLILGQILFALGFAFSVTARSLVTNLVEKKDLATVYTGITVMKYGGALTGSPLLATTFGWGMQWGDPWVGLPFLVAGGLFALALLLVSSSSLEPFEKLPESEEASLV
jgi:MFS family permease